MIVYAEIAKKPVKNFSHWIGELSTALGYKKKTQSQFYFYKLATKNLDTR